MTAIAPPPWSQQLLSVGVTGTNGKTSTTRWIAACLARVASPVAQATTLGSFLDDEPFEAPKTYQGFLATMAAAVERGGRFAVLELTSEALAKGFARAWPCKVGVFTNLTHDHLDAHGTPEHYLASKAQLFLHLKAGGTAVLNGCDAASELIKEIIPPGIRVLSYGVPSRGKAVLPLDVEATSVETSWRGTAIGLRSSLDGMVSKLTIPAIGAIYAENALAALLGAMAAGAPCDVAAAALEAAVAPPGRFQVVHEKPYVVVDYAHTPDALARTLRIARALRSEGAKLTVVFGAGGHRDTKKRGPMGRSASLADRVVLTSDNPRTEDPRAIARAIRAGIKPKVNVKVELDRAKAIRLALRDAKEDDIVVLAGKGHETEQTIGTVVSMVFNFKLNNSITYRDQRLRGPRLWRGLVLFMVVCGVGAIANIGIAKTLYESNTAWTVAGTIGAVIGVVWNYAVSATLVWRAR